MTRARALLLATATLAPMAASAQAVTSPSLQSGTADAIRVLLDQATYWRNQFQLDKANEALGRVLVLDPGNADALAMQAQAAADRGDAPAARSALARLRTTRPEDPRLGDVEQALKTGPVDQAALAQARALAQAGRTAAAVAAYRAAFKSETPTPGLATEYYQALASTDENWAIPRAGLAAVLRANPQNLRAQLAYAELLTAHDETRSEGIDRLSKLAQNPVIATRAERDLRQALLRLPVTLASVPQYDLYLAKHPEDFELARLEQLARTDPAALRVAGLDATSGEDTLAAVRPPPGAATPPPAEPEHSAPPRPAVPMRPAARRTEPPQRDAAPSTALDGKAAAQDLRQRAEEEGDPAAMLAVLRAGVDAHPGDPWVRLELARALHRQGSDAQAREVMAPVGRDRRAALEQVEAAIAFASEMRDDAQLASLVGRLPAGAPDRHGPTQMRSPHSDAADTQGAALQPPRRYALAGATANDASDTLLPDPVTREYGQFYAAPDAAPSPPVSREDQPFGPVSPAPRYAAPMAIPIRRNAQTVPSDNPFRTTDIPDEPIPAGRATRLAAADPLTVQITQGIQQIEQETAPRLEGSLSLRGRTGTPGLERLFEVEAPIEATYSPNGYGRLKVIVTPTYLYSGRSGTAFDQARFGTNPLGPLGPAAAALRSQAAAGAALDVAYTYGITTVDVGASPFGFREQNAVGGIELAPKLTSIVTLRALLERRMVTDSILSFGGMKDYRTGTTWGGVARNRAHLQLEASVGSASFYAGAGGALLTGDRVAQNSEIEAGAGASTAVWRDPNKEVRLGVDLVYFGYDRNLSGFSLGQGGYFSPQQFFAVLLPASFRHQPTPDLTYTVGGSIGYQIFRSQSSAVFPNDSTRQAALVALAATTAGTATTVAGIHGSGVAGGAQGEIDYRLFQDLHIGARAAFERSGNFTEGTGLVYARYQFNNTP